MARNVDLLEGSIVGSLTSLALPIMATSLIQMAYNMTDMIWIGRLSADAVAAVGAAGMYLWLANGLAMIPRLGGQVKVAHELGAQAPERAAGYGQAAFHLGALLVILFTAMCILLNGPLIAFFKLNSPQVNSDARVYLVIVALGFLFSFFNQIFTGLFTAMGSSVVVLRSTAVGLVGNILLDPLMIFGVGPFPRMEVAGAALATVLGQVVGMVVGLCMVRRSSIVRLSFRGFRPDGAIIRTMFRVGVPAILVQALATVMNLGMNLILPLFTASGVFILGAYFKLQSFLFMPVNGLNNALIPIVSFNYGARQRSRITGVIHFALVLSAAIMAVGTVVFLVIPGPLLRLFDADAAVLAEGISALRLIALSFVCAGVSVILCAALQALGAANSSLVVSLLRQLVLLFPLALLLGALRPSLVWLAFLLSEGAACLTALLLYRRTARGRLAGMEE